VRRFLIAWVWRIVFAIFLIAVKNHNTPLQQWVRRIVFAGFLIANAIRDIRVRRFLIASKIKTRLKTATPRDKNFLICQPYELLLLNLYLYKKRS